MAEAIWNTCFDISDKTKDNVKARQDLELLCNCPSLHLYFFYALKEAKHGPGKGTIINAFCCMKAGLKNCDANGNAGPIPERAKKLVVCRTFYLVSCFSICSFWLIIYVISRMTTMKHWKENIQRTSKSKLLMVK